ncbi:hypothetical protein ACFQ2H_35765 [Streptomyces violaceoruber]
MEADRPARDVQLVGRPGAEAALLEPAELIEALRRSRRAAPPD